MESLASGYLIDGGLTFKYRSAHGDNAACLDLCGICWQDWGVGNST